MEETSKVLLALICSTGLVAGAHAEAPRPLAPGALVRVTAPGVSRGRITGTLVSASDREFVLALAGQERASIPRSAVRRFEWSPGLRRHPIPGAMIGGILGGAFLAYASVAACDAASCSPSMEAFLVGVGLGALPGAGIGALVRTRAWTDVEPSRVQLTLAPVRGHGLGVRLAVRF